MPRAQFCKSSAFAYNSAFKELFSLLPTFIWAVATCHSMCAILQGWTFFARPTRSKRSRKKCAKWAQIGVKRCKRAQIQETLPLNPKGFLTHVYLCLSEHPDTICREKCKTTARKNLWRADLSKRNTFSFTSVNARFRAETQRHVNLRYFGGPRHKKKNKI